MFISKYIQFLKIKYSSVMIIHLFTFCTRMQVCLWDKFLMNFFYSVEWKSICNFSNRHFLLKMYYVYLVDNY